MSNPNSSQSKLTTAKILTFTLVEAILAVTYGILKLVGVNADLALASYLFANAGFFGWFCWFVVRNVESYSNELEAVRGDIQTLKADSIEGKRLETIDDLFSCLCEARDRCQSRIRLMQIREEPPIRFNDDGTIALNEGKPVLVRTSRFAEIWYDGLAEWVSRDRHQGERITLGEGNSLTYARYIDRQMEIAGATTWTTHLLKEKPVGLPAYNFCIFDEQEIVITFGVAYGNSGRSVWLRDQSIVQFFINVFDKIASDYSNELHL